MNCFGITFKAPENSIFLVIVLVAMLFVVYRTFYAYHLIKILGKTVNGRTFLKHISFTRIITKAVLWLLALFFITITLMHPCWNKKEETVVQEGRDLFIALDISRSMLATDITPSRLECAKTKIKRLVQSLPSERIGLILFSGSSFIQCPLTRDRGAFFMYLDHIDSNTIASGSTALEKPIAQALQAFGKSGTARNKLLVIFTDGEDFSTNLESLKQEAASQGLTIVTFGIGTPLGSPIPIIDQNGKQSGHLKDKNGTVVISRLNNTLLEDLAQAVGGLYLPVAHDESDIKQAIHLIMQREKEKIEERTMGQLEEQYPLFLLIGFILLIIEWLL